ncbi:MAG: hypothetical protein IKI97_15320, partial [Clostridia bacterium]|nr:hypothetical protein [Clostridia bacterium]
MRQVIKRGQTNACFNNLDFGPKFSKHWICIRKSVKTERFYHHTPTQKIKERRINMSKRKREIDFHVYLSEEENEVLNKFCKV